MQVKQNGRTLELKAIAKNLPPRKRHTVNGMKGKRQAAAGQRCKKPEVER
jgi:hypothetical protein